MVALCVFATYILIGLILNWGSIFIVYGRLMRICKNHSEVYFDVFKKYEEQKIGFNMNGYSQWAKIVVTQLLWPVNVFNTINCGIPAIKEAKDTIGRIEEQ